MPTLRPPVITSTAVNAIKLLACLLMVVDHVNVILLGRSVPALSVLGRLVFPLFALLAAYHLLHHSRNPHCYVQRLFFAGLLSQPAYALSISPVAQGWLALNILFTLCLGLALLQAVLEAQQRQRPRDILPWLAVVLLVGPFVDYGIVGIALILTAGWWLHSSEHWALALLVLCLATLNLAPRIPMAVISTLAALPLFLWMATRHYRLPRLPQPAFYLFYPGHLLLLYLASCLATGRTI